MLPLGKINRWWWRWWWWYYESTIKVKDKGGNRWRWSAIASGCRVLSPRRKRKRYKMSLL